MLRLRLRRLPVIINGYYINKHLTTFIREMENIFTTVSSSIAIKDNKGALNIRILDTMAGH